MPLERERIAISSQRNNDRYGKASSLKKLQQQGSSRLVLRMYEDWTDPIDRDLREIVKTKKAIATPPLKPQSKPKATKPPKGERGVSPDSIRQRFKALFPQILHSDRAIGIQTVLSKANELGLDITYDLVKEYLYQFSKEGVVFKAIKEHKYNAYALQPTDEIDPLEWLPAEIAYQIALKNGYDGSYNYFRNRPHSWNIPNERLANFYAQYGLEYRFGHKVSENHKWRVLNGSVS